MPDAHSPDDRPAPRRPWVAPAVLLAIVLAVAGWSLRPQEAPAQRSQDGGIIEEFSPGERATVGPISGRTIDGGQFDSADLAGKVIVYNVWGSWCGPCRKEAPDLQRLSVALRPKGVRFVGLDVKDNDANALAFEREFGITYPSISTSDSGRALLALGQAVPLGAVPTTVVVDRQGRAAARIVGVSTYYTLKTLIDDIVAEGP